MVEKIKAIRRRMLDTQIESTYRQQNECPDCWDKGWEVKGKKTGEVSEFQDSISYTYECPRCGKRFVHSVKPKPRKKWKGKTSS